MGRLETYLGMIDEQIRSPAVPISTFFRNLLADLDGRLSDTELAAADFRLTNSRLEAVALTYLASKLVPEFDRVRVAADLGQMFEASSTSALTVATGEVEIVVAEADRGRFSAPGYILIRKVGTPGVWMLGQKISYDRPSGLLVVDVARVGGLGAVAASWSIAAASEGAIPTAGDGDYTSDQVVVWPPVLGQSRVQAVLGALVTELGLRRSKSEEAWVTPFDFGAVGDGVTDDTAAILAGIAASAASGRALVIPPGEFRCTNTFALQSGAHLRGGGDREHCILRLDYSGSTAYFLDANGVVNVTIDNLTVDAGRDGALVSGNAIRFRGASSHCMVNNVAVINSPREHVLIRDGCSHITVQGCDFDALAGGAGHVYLLTDVVDCNIVNNKMAGGVGGCIWLSGRCHRNTISGNRNTARSDYELIGIRWDCENGVVSNNYADTTGDNGISVTGTGWTVSGNQCTNCDFAGIGVYGQDNAVFGNILWDNGRGGGSVYGGLRVQAAYGGLGKNNTISANQIFIKDGLSTEQYYGIRIDSTSYTLWSTGAAVTTDSFRYYGNNLYRAVASGTTGATPPTHSTGTVSDDVVDWEFVGSFDHRLARAAGNRSFGNRIGPHAGGAYLRGSTSSSDFDDQGLRSRSVYIGAGWTTATVYSAGQLVYNQVDGVRHIYRATMGGTSGSTAPTHTSSTASDGGVTWLYVGDGPSLEIEKVTYAQAVISVPLIIQQIDSSSATGPGLYAGSMNPENNVTALSGSLYLRNNSTYGIQAYIKSGGANNTGWKLLAYRESGATGLRPAPGAGGTGAVYFDTTLGKPIWWTGSAWVDAAGVSV